MSHLSGWDMNPNSIDQDQRYRDWLAKNATIENCHYIRIHGADDGLLIAEEQGWGFSEYIEALHDDNG